VTEGLLLAVPLGSLLLRLALALAASLLLVTLLERAGLRSPRARVLVALSPFVVTALVALLATGDPGLPTVMAPTSGAATLAIPVEGRYLEFAPRTLPWLLIWPVVSALLLLQRWIRSRRRFALLAEGARPVSPRTSAVVVRLARALEVRPPRVRAAPVVRGGAALLGVRDPLLVLDERLLAVLDPAELEGVIAHELAHLARRDNLVAWAAAAVGDAVWFLPGASGAMRRLRREREAAADLRAVEVTGRPGALASALLRALDLTAPTRRGVPQGCAALVEPTGLVGRVRLLVAAEPPTATRHRGEVAIVVAVGVLAVALATLVPALLTGPDGRREALAVLVGDPVAAPVTGGRSARVVEVYGRTVPTGPVAAGPAGVAVPRDLLALDRPGAAATCARVPGACRASVRGPAATVRPDPIVLTEAPPARWQAIPVRDGAAGDRLTLFWLARLDAAAPLPRP
jgi:beta-lactamase regulating signal transducer with metallopeptidase domain